MLIQVQNKLVDLDAVVLADMHYPDSEDTDDWMELSLSFTKGASTTLYGEQAEFVWGLLKQLCAANFTIEPHPTPNPENAPVNAPVIL